MKNTVIVVQSPIHALEIALALQSKGCRPSGNLLDARRVYSPQFIAVDGAGNFAPYVCASSAADFAADNVGTFNPKRKAITQIFPVPTKVLVDNPAIQPVEFEGQLWLKVQSPSGNICLKPFVAI